MGGAWKPGSGSASAGGCGISAAMAPLERVEVAAVTRSFGGIAALRGVDLTLEAGTITVLEGPNGAGKSTLLAIIGTLVRPTSGRVTYVPFGEDQERAREVMGWVAHDAQCYRELTGRQNVELMARLHGLEPRSAWAEVAERVGAQGFGERRFGTLSRGQRQRIALARALVHGPSLLLLDEAWTGLDSTSADQLERVVREEQRAGAVIVVVSHDSGLAERLKAQRVRIERGRRVH